MEGQELMHYGILGMKWGVRRTEEQLRRARGKTESDESTTTEKKESSSTSKKKSISEMSDDELRKAVQRLQLEKQYRDLSPKDISRGEQFVKTLQKQVVGPAFTEAGKQVLKDYLVKSATKAIDKNKKK